MTASKSDFFVSYASDDRRWAQWIGQQLAAAGATYQLDVWDWKPGEDFVLRMQQALEQSDRLLAAWTPTYFTKGPFAQAEFRAAFADQLRKNEPRVLPVRVEKLEIPVLFSTLIYVDLVDLDETTAAATLRAALIGSRPTAPVPFPGTPTPTP